MTLFTSSFQHWEKAQRDVEKACYCDLPYRVVFIPEPGYKKNLDLARIMSHRKAAKNLRRMLSERFAADAVRSISSTPRFRPTTLPACARRRRTSMAFPSLPT